MNKRDRFMYSYMKSQREMVILHRHLRLKATNETFSDLNVNGNIQKNPTVNMDV